MNSLTIVALCTVLAATHASHSLVGPPAPGVVLHGPSAKASLIGPDGSHISAVAPGGAVLAAPKPGGVVSAAVVPGHVGVGYGYGIAPAVYAAPALVGYEVGYHPLAPGSGHEGQYIPDYTEKLYDDGSYKGEVIGHGLYGYH